jgi:hypothetical protein
MSQMKRRGGGGKGGGADLIIPTMKTGSFVVEPTPLGQNPLLKIWRMRAVR